MRIWDGLRNLVSGIGTPKDKTTSNFFAFQPISQVEMEALYLDDGFARKIVDIIPGDMVREWRTWEARQAETIYEAEKALHVRGKVLQALTWGRLHGGAAILIGDGSPDPTQPFDPASITKGGIKYLHVFNRFELKRGEYERSILSPDYGLPRTFFITAPEADVQVEVHRSRFAIFDGYDAPRLYRQLNDGWGMSVFQAIRTALINVAASTANAAALTEEAKLDIVTMPNLTDELSTTEGTQRVITRYATAMQLKSTINTLLLGTGETFERKQVSFTGWAELIKTHIEIAAGVADIPVTRLYGTAPKGLNATGDSDTRNYYDSIRARQTNSLASSIWVLDEALIRHAIGRRPRNVTYSWVPLWQPTPTELAAIAKTKADTDAVYAGIGLLPARGFANAVLDRLIGDGSYPTIDQHIVPDDLKVLGDAPLSAKEVAPPKGGDVNGLEKGTSAQIADAGPKTLYVSRPVVNAKAILDWARKQGFATTLAADDLHVTVAFSREPVDWFAVSSWSASERLRIAPGGPRDIEQFDGGAVVLLFASDELQWRWCEFRDIGASWDHDDYQPHVTLTYEAGSIDLSKVEPYAGPIIFGPERFAEVDENWKAKVAA